MNAKPPTRSRLQGAGRAVGPAEVGQNVEGAFVVRPADLGQAHPARGASQLPAGNGGTAITAVRVRWKGAVVSTGRRGSVFVPEGPGPGATYAFRRRPLSRAPRPFIEPILKARSGPI
jgi:hypothetical protein